MDDLTPARTEVESETLRMFKHAARIMISCRGAKMLIVMILISYALTSISPYLNGLFVDILVYGQDLRSVLLLAASIALIGIFAAFFTYHARIVQTSVVNRTYFHLLKEVVSDFQHLPLSEIENTELLYSAQRLNADTSTVATFIVTNIVPMFINGFVMIIVFIIIISSNIFIAIAGMALLGLYLIITYILKTPMFSASLQKKEAEGHFFNAMASRIERAFEIKLMANYSRSFNVVESLFDSDYLPSVIRLAKVQNAFSSSDRIISSIFQAILLIVSGVRIVMGNMTIGEFTMINSYYSLLLSCAKYYVNLIQTWQDANASVTRLEDIKAHSSYYQGKEPVEEVVNVHLSNLNFVYEHEGTLVDIVSNFSFDFEKGKTYVVIGPNGSGKSTLLKLILGFYESTGSSIFYNKKVISEIDLDKARLRSFSMLTQSSYVPDETVGEYLLEAGIDNMITDEYLSLGDVGDIELITNKQCRELSGGEFRKLRLLRSLQKQATYLVLDEPTNDLDEKTCEKLIQFIKDNPRKQAIIIVTHDSRMLNVADIVMKMNGNGEIEVTG
ncbi:ABC transporter ATP-binding protein [Lancefieldella rimae]|uniref:ABC transporter ATP-binding protein n=1 Tax=Lancefieldella rimae TaxID=1383 RepID=UPI0028EF3EA6|nr:ABC transporter ATP-binding protein [Lancefieldella rimae]